MNFDETGYLRDLLYGFTLDPSSSSFKRDGSLAPNPDVSLGAGAPGLEYLKSCLFSTESVPVPTAGSGGAAAGSREPPPGDHAVVKLKPVLKLSGHTDDPVEVEAKFHDHTALGGTSSLYLLAENPRVGGQTPSDVLRFLQIKAKDLLLNLTINHTVHTCHFKPLGDNTSLVEVKDSLYYFATSPDELAFCATCSEFGISLTGREGDVVDYSMSSESMFNFVFNPAKTLSGKGTEERERSVRSDHTF